MTTTMECNTRTWRASLIVCVLRIVLERCAGLGVGGGAIPIMSRNVRFTRFLDSRLGNSRRSELRGGGIATHLRRGHLVKDRHDGQCWG